MVEALYTVLIGWILGLKCYITILQNVHGPRWKKNIQIFLHSISKKYI